LGVKQRQLLSDREPIWQSVHWLPFCAPDLQLVGQRHPHFVLSPALGTENPGHHFLATTIDIIQATSDLYFAPGSTSTHYITGNGHQVEIRLFDDTRRTTYNLVSRSCRLDNLKIVGNGSSIFNFNNESSLSNVYMQNCHLENLITEGTQLFASGNTSQNLINNGNFYNYNGGNGTLHHQGYFHNHGQVGQAPHKWMFTLYTYGDIYNDGLFNPTYLYLSGSNDRTLQSTETNPIKASSSLYCDASLGDIYVGDQLWFANIPTFNGLVNFKAYTIANLPRTLNFSNMKLNQSTIQGMAGSALNGSSFTLYSVTISGLDLQGALDFDMFCSLTNVTNHAILRNFGSGSRELEIHGNFANYGTITSAYGFLFTVKAYDDVLNYGTWSSYNLYFLGDDAQNIRFGAEHPFTGVNFVDQNTTAGLYVVEDDLHIHATTMDLNYSTLHLTPGDWSFYLVGTLLTRANVISNLNCNLDLSSNSRVTLSTFESITNTGVLNLGSNTGFSGSLVNNGTLQNYGNSVVLAVAGDLTNNGVIQDQGGYLLTVNLSGNALNNGVWNNYFLNLNGAASQNIHFPADHPFTGSNLIDNVATSPLTTTADLYFAGSNVDLNYCTLILTGGFHLNLDNCHLLEANVQSSLSSVLTMTNGSRASLCSFQSITTAGTVILATSTTVSGDLVNNGILRNYSNSNILSVAGNLINNGSIENNPGWLLTVNVAGNAINNGSWSNYSLNLNGTETQLIHFPAGHGFNGSLLTDTDNSSALTVDCDTYFQGVNLTLNNSSLILTGGYDLHLDNCNLNGAAIQSDETSILDMTSGGSIANCSFQSITFDGTVILTTGITVANNLVNSGTLRNQGSSMHVYVNGLLTNQGSITNYGGYLLYVHCSGHLVNSGSFDIYQLYFDGASAQQLTNTGTLGVSIITDSNAASPVILNTDLWLTNTNVDLNNATLILNSGTRTGKTLNLSGGYLSNAMVVGGNGAKVVMGNSAYLGNCTFDEIIWEGTVYVQSNVVVENLTNNGTLMNRNGVSPILTVNGQLYNSGTGTIANYPGYNLYMHLYSDLYDHGILSNHTLSFRSSSDQQIYQGATADTIRCSYIQKTTSTGNLIMLSDLVLKNCILSLNNRSLIMQSGRTSHDLSLYGGYINNAYLDSDNFSTLYMANNAYLGSGVSGKDLTFEGTVILRNDVYFDNLVNNAVIINGNGYNTTLNVYGRLDNYGTITKYAGYSMYLKLYGDLYHYGYLDCSQLNLAGNADQQLYQAPGADDFRCPSIVKTTTSGDVVMLSGLRMVNCYLSLNNRNLVMQSGGTDHSLSLDGGYIVSTYLSSPGNSILNLSNGAYLNGISGGNLTLQGSVLLQGSCNFGSLVNYAYARNRPNYSPNLYLSGNLVNYGTFHSDDYNLYLYVAGNLTNHGTLSNYRIYLNGTEDQNAQLNGTETITYLTLNSNIGNAAWYRNGVYSGSTGTALNLTMGDPNLYGAWQPYVSSTNTWGRIITISPLGTLEPPQNLIIATHPDGIRLQWNQVPGATSYTIYASLSPSAGFTVLLENITDPDPGDGIVAQILPATQDRRFFRITANN